MARASAMKAHAREDDRSKPPRRIATRHLLATLRLLHEERRRRWGRLRWHALRNVRLRRVRTWNGRDRKTRPSADTELPLGARVRPRQDVTGGPSRSEKSAVLLARTLARSALEIPSRSGRTIWHLAPPPTERLWECPRHCCPCSCDPAPQKLHLVNPGTLLGEASPNSAKSSHVLVKPSPPSVKCRPS